MASRLVGRRIAVGVAGVALSAAVLTWAPAIVSFGFAVVAAISWCIWLEEHRLDIENAPRKDQTVRLPIR
jgi:hypothetical protein